MSSVNQGTGAAVCLLFLAVSTSCSKPQPVESTAPPHVVFILLDDLGWNDVGYNGSEIPTPEIDRLYANSVRFEDFYALPLCTPSRAALLTGRHPLRYGLQDSPLRYWHDAGIPAEETTLAEALQEVGYRTHIVGKWHLGHRSPYLPLEHGFETHYGNYLSASLYFEHTNNDLLDWYRDGEPLVEKGYTTNLLAKEAKRIIAEHDEREPLFLYVPFTAVHAPLNAPPRVYRDARFDHIEDQGRRMHAAVTWLADRAIGEIDAAIEARGWAENTLLVVCSDNGAADYHNGSNLPLRDGKGSIYEGGVRVPAFCRWPGWSTEGRPVADPVHLVDWFPTIARLAGVGAAELQRLELDGRDLGPLLTGSGQTFREELILNASPYGSALRLGDWKLVELPREDGSGTRRELYDLRSDLSEERDLSASEPERLSDLGARLETWQERSVPLLVPRLADDPERKK